MQDIVSNVTSPVISLEAKDRLSSMESKMDDAFASLGNLNETFTKFLTRNSSSSDSTLSATFDSTTNPNLK